MSSARTETQTVEKQAENFEELRNFAQVGQGASNRKSYRMYAFNRVDTRAH